MVAFRLGTQLCLLTFAAGLVVGSLGYGRLARFLTSSVVAGGVLALLHYAVVQVVSGVLAFVLRVWPLRDLHLVRHHRDRGLRSEWIRGGDPELPPRCRWALAVTS